MAATESPKKPEDARKSTTPEPVGSAASFTSDSSSLPLSGRPPLAGESSDPAVQKLLADKNALQMNRDTLDPPVDKAALKVVDEEIAEVDQKLADLGFKQQTQAERKAAQEKAADAEAKKVADAEKRIEAAKAKATEDDKK